MPLRCPRLQQGQKEREGISEKLPDGVNVSGSIPQQMDNGQVWLGFRHESVTLVLVSSLVENLFLYGGIVLVVAFVLRVVVQLLSSVTQSSQETEHRRLAMELLTQRISAACKHQDRAVKEAATWNGWRKFQIMRKVPETGQICSFYLVPHDHKPIPPFEPGQYLTFQLNISDQTKPVVRCYSLSDGVREDYYRVSIKRAPAPRDKPDVSPGLGSNFFHDHIHEGDIIDVKAPGGHFYLDLEKITQIVLIGGGIGMTPVLSMLNMLTHDGILNREVYWFLGVRNSAEHPFKRSVEELGRQHEKLHLHVCYSNPNERDVQGTDYQHDGRVSVELFKQVLPSNNFDYYICGPPQMMASVVPALEAWGVPHKNIHYEAFGSASVKKVKKEEESPPEEAQARAAAATFTVKFEKSGVECQWDGSCENLLEFGEANDVVLDSGCRAGNCGACEVAIKDGQVAYSVDLGAKPEDGSCLTCIASPKSDLVVDA